MKFLSDIPKPEGYIYLASPYNSENVGVKLIRHLCAESATAYIIEAGFSVYSPIVHMHFMAVNYNLTDRIPWHHINRPLLESCSELWILMIDGWQESVGLTGEILLARELGKPERYIYSSENAILVMEDH